MDRIGGTSPGARSCGTGEASQLSKEIQIRAERKAGEFLLKMKKATATEYREARKRPGRIVEPDELTPRLRDLGISKDNSHRWQTVARWLGRLMRRL